MSPDCNFTHCSYTYSPDGSGHGYCVSVEAVGCVTRVTECQSVPSCKLMYESSIHLLFVVHHKCNYLQLIIFAIGCDPDELVADVGMVTNIEMGYIFLEGQVTYSGISEGSNATYTPNEGYSLSGCSSGIRVCTNGQWSSETIPMFEKGRRFGQINHLCIMLLEEGI